MLGLYSVQRVYHSSMCDCGCQQFVHLQVRVNKVVSKVNHQFQSTQDQSVNIVIELSFFTVVLHSKDEVERDPKFWTEIFDLF